MRGGHRLGLAALAAASNVERTRSRAAALARRHGHCCRAACALAVGAWLLLASPIGLRAASAQEPTASVAPTAPAWVRAGLLRALSDGDQSVSLQTLELANEHALWQLLRGAKEAVPRIVPLLAAGEWQVRQAAAQALGQLGAKEAVPQIVPLLGDGECTCGRRRRRRWASRRQGGRAADRPPPRRWRMARAAGGGAGAGPDRRQGGRAADRPPPRRWRHATCGRRRRRRWASSAPRRPCRRSSPSSALANG